MSTTITNVSMSRITLYIGIIALCVNVAFGAILTCYDTFNVAVSSGSIIITCALIYTIAHIRMKDAFKVSLTLLFVLLGLVDFVLTAFAPSHFTDNWCIVLFMVLCASQVAMLIVTHVVSNRIH